MLAVERRWQDHEGLYGMREELLAEQREHLAKQDELLAKQRERLAKQRELLAKREEYDRLWEEVKNLWTWACLAVLFDVVFYVGLFKWVSTAKKIKPSAKVYGTAPRLVANKSGLAKPALDGASEGGEESSVLPMPAGPLLDEGSERLESPGFAGR